MSPHDLSCGKANSNTRTSSENAKPLLVVGPAEPVRSTPAGRADQEQPTLWRMARDCARTARRRPCAEAQANGMGSSSKMKVRS